MRIPTLTEQQIEDFQTALAAIRDCVNYKLFHETIDYGESDYTLELWEKFNDAAWIISTKYNAEQLAKLMKAAKDKFDRDEDNYDLGKTILLDEENDNPVKTIFFDGKDDDFKD